MIAQERLPERIGGRYWPIRRIATGGMSTVFEVEHEHTGERLALKMLRDSSATFDPVALDRFRREARVASLVKSDHIARVVDADVTPELGEPYLVMDLLDGFDLARLCGDRPQPPERVVGWLEQVARAVEKAHRRGVIHRDLKPENLFLARRHDDVPIVKVLDFGIAKLASGDNPRSTATWSVVGTPLYMAPEQAAGTTSSIGPGTDIWAIGIIAFRLLTGRDYWNATDIRILLAQIVCQPVDPPSARGCDFGAEFDQWFLRSCASEPSRRFGTVTEQVDALGAALGVTRATKRSGDSGSLESSSPSRSRLHGRRRTTLPLTVLVTAVSAAVILFLFAKPPTERRLPANGTPAFCQTLAADLQP